MGTAPLPYREPICSNSKAEAAGLQARLKLNSTPASANPLDIVVPTGAPEQRLQLLEADIRLNLFAQYERLQAQQVVTALATVSRRTWPAAMALAERRVGIAEQAARIEAAKRALERLASERSELRGGQPARRRPRHGGG